MNEKIRLGISSCLLGNKVRYDGGHKLDRFLTDTLGRWVEYVPVCPEVECGMAVPRESMRLEGNPEYPRLITTRTKIDKTQQMAAWAGKRIVELEKENLSGFIFKSGSPSSGMERVKVYDGKGMPSRKGVGIFARAFMEHFPLLPVEDDGRLNDSGLRENFIERVFALARWRKILEGKKNRGSLVEFHTGHKLLILSHSTKYYSEMGKLVAHSREIPVKELFAQYEERLLQALKLVATVKKNTNVLMHMAGYFKKQLTSDEKKELLETIDLYRKGLMPLVVPLTLVNHYVRKYDQPYLRRQYYLNPHPAELKLRTQVLYPS
jgi:uncharacterized protein YbgA (DUF1722 family)/uncharacterized protein YbbK (DUF523 family)